MKTTENFPSKPYATTIGFKSPHGKRKQSRISATTLMFAAMAGFVIFLSGCATEPHVPVKDTSRTFTTVVIDPGHGGKDSGTWSKARRGPQVLEKTVALDVGLRLNTKLKEAGFKTVMTRRSDVFIPLETRARISNAQTNAIYVSIHFNDSPKRGIHGIETYYNSQPSIPLAEKIEGKLDTLSRGSDRGVKYANFRVLKLNRYPAVLVECGFLSNKSEAIRAASPVYRDILASKIADAIYEQRHGGNREQAVAAAKTQTSQPATAPVSNPE